MNDSEFAAHSDADVTKSRFKPVLLVAILLIDFLLIAAALVVYMAWPPNEQFPKTITIAPGTTAADIATQLAEARIVKSADFLYGSLVAFEDPSAIKAGAHVFSEPMHVLAVAHFITHNVPADELIAITFPEGFTHFEFNQFLPQEIAPIETDLTQYEGKLFPDTYLVPVDYTAADLLDLMQTTQTEKIAPLTQQITASTFSPEEVIILASIIEREANDATSMRLVSGILRNRLDIGMPLQVDASVAYGLGISGTELTRTHLETDGPFNTYTRRGLPPTPIANPGLMAIEAVLNPTPSDNLFYITGNDGNFYYAETLDQHNINVARHLR